MPSNYHANRTSISLSSVRILDRNFVVLVTGRGLGLVRISEHMAFLPFNLTFWHMFFIWSEINLPTWKVKKKDYLVRTWLVQILTGELCFWELGQKYHKMVAAYMLIQLDVTTFQLLRQCTVHWNHHHGWTALTRIRYWIFCVECMYEFVAQGNQLV